MKSEFHEDDELELFPLQEYLKIPYYSIVLTKEEAMQVEGKMAFIYEIDGHQLIDLKNEKGQLTGEKLITVCWFGKK